MYRPPNLTVAAVTDRCYRLTLFFGSLHELQAYSQSGHAPNR